MVTNAAHPPSMADYTRIEVRPISPAIGAEINSVDVSGPLDDATISEIRRALLRHLVVFFRDQRLDVESHKAFSRRFGELFVRPNYQLGQGEREMVFLTRTPGDTSVAGEDWHTDATMMPVPPMGAILHALEVPSIGADTLFANQYLAFETLSPGMQRVLESLHAVHDDSRVAGPRAGINARRTSHVREDADWQPTVNSHPVVYPHPETGRKCLFVNPAYTQRFEHMGVEESAPLLTFLYRHASRPELTCRFRWDTGSIAFWDNRCTMHLALNDVRARRRMQRTQIAG